jgi:hypothetical protein
MRFGWVFMEQQKPAEAEVRGIFRCLEKVLGIEFAITLFYRHLVPVISDGQVGLDDLAGRLQGGGFDFERNCQIPIRLNFPWSLPFLVNRDYAAASGVAFSPRFLQLEHNSTRFLEKSILFRIRTYTIDERGGIYWMYSHKKPGFL